MSVLTAFCVLPSLTHASIETVYGSLPASLTSYEDAAISVQQFDPSLGALQSVTIEVTGTGNFTQYYQNISTGSGDTIAISQTLNLALQLGSEAILDLSQVNQHNYVVSAWNGSPPFYAGTAGGTQSYAVTAAGHATLTSPTDLAEFSGSGLTDLLLSALANASATDSNGGNFFGGSAVTAGANVTVAYNYSAVPESATWLPAAGIAMAVAIARRPKHVTR
jgi:hypothetical protein